jgi:hypothetical protein
LKYLSIVVALNLFFLNCNDRNHTSNVSEVKKKVYSHPIDPIKIKLRIDRGYQKPLSSFRENIIKLNDKYYLNYINTSKNLIFVPVFSEENTHEISLQQYLDNSPNSISVLIKDSIVYSLIRSRDLIYSLHIDSNFKIVKIDSVKFGQCYDRDEIYIKDDIDQPFEVIQNTYFLPIGSLSKRKIFVNEKSYLTMSLTNGKLVSRQCLETPKEYMDGLRKAMVTYIYPLDSNRAAFMFQDIDRVIVFDLLSMNCIGSYDFNPYSNYEIYDYSQRRDLGYVRVYMETNEANFKILISNNKIILLKKIRSKDIFEPRKFEYLVLNDKNEIQNFDSIPFKIQPFLSFAYNKGFVLVDKNMTDAYYYKIF